MSCIGMGLFLRVLEGFVIKIEVFLVKMCKFVKKVIDKVIGVL